MSNADQKEFWNAQTKWVTLQEAMDRCLQPVLDQVIALAGLQSGERVLDIGCGTGASVLALADAVGPDGHVTGLDIAAALLDVARSRGSHLRNVDYLLADAAEEQFEDTYDIVVSRFGVMFFSDTTAAFTNIARALKPTGRFAMAAWGPAPKNPYFMVPAATVKRVFGPMPPVDRRLPGPFAFEEQDHVREMLERAGLKTIEITSYDCDLTPPGTIEEAAELLISIGPATRALDYFKADDAQRAHLKAELIKDLAAFSDRGTVQLPANLNLITAMV